MLAIYLYSKGKFRNHREDYISQIAWEDPGILQEEMKSVALDGTSQVFG